MTPLVQSLLAGLGGLALASSLLLQKKQDGSLWSGRGSFFPLAVWNVDPVLALGLLALLAAWRPRSPTSRQERGTLVLPRRNRRQWIGPAKALDVAGNAGY